MRQILETVPSPEIAEAVIWVFRFIVVMFVGIIAWFLKRTATDLDHCEGSIAKIKETDLPALDKRVSLMEHRMGHAENDIGQLQLRDVVKGSKPE